MSGFLRPLFLPALAAACAISCSDLVPVPSGRPNVPDGGAGPPGPDARTEDLFDTANEMIAAFGNCMSYTDWVNQRMNMLPLQTTIEGDTCAACHSQQGTGAFLSEDPVRTYTRHRLTPSIYKLALPVLDETTGEPSDVVQNDRYVVKGTEPDNGHDEYNLDPEIEDGLNGFFELTYARFETLQGACEPDNPI